MTQQEYTKTIAAELNMLNRQIDLKIIKGLSYTYESRKHKMLLQKLKNQNKSIFSKFFGRLAVQY